MWCGKDWENKCLITGRILHNFPLIKGGILPHFKFDLKSYERCKWMFLGKDMKREMVIERKTKLKVQGVKERTLRPVGDIDETEFDANGKSLGKENTNPV